MNGERKKACMYFLAVVLPMPLDAKVTALKNEMLNKYGCRVALRSPAHITLIPPFWMPEESEPALHSDLRLLGTTTAAFRVVTADFSAFKQATLFIAVQESEELLRLKKSADAFFRSSTYPVKIDDRPFHPHVTIATRDLYKKDFAEAWTHFQHQTFREAFDATGLSLLKHNGKSWDVLLTAAFNG